MSESFVDWNDEEGRVLVEGTESWTATGQQLQIVLTTIEPGRVFPPHSHPHEQFCVVLEGTIGFDVEGRGSRTLGPRGVFYFGPNEVHGARVVGEQPVTLLEAFHPIRLDYVDSAMAADHDLPR